MRWRFSAIAAGAVVIAVIGILKLGYGPTATSREASGSASKTPWGDPDLQGIWTNEHQIPLQRPAQYANKEFFTDEEIAELDTRRAAAKSLGDYQGSREHLHLVERFTRVDADTLEYQVTIEDPTTWTSPWIVKQEWTRQNDQANRVYYEPRCHEGNYGMAALLAGARADERAFRAGRGPDPATLCVGGCGLGIPDEERDPLQ